MLSFPAADRCLPARQSAAGNRFSAPSAGADTAPAGGTDPRGCRAAQAARRTNAARYCPDPPGAAGPPDAWPAAKPEQADGADAWPAPVTGPDAPAKNCRSPQTCSRPRRRTIRAADALPRQKAARQQRSAGHTGPRRSRVFLRACFTLAARRRAVQTWPGLCVAGVVLLPKAKKSPMMALGISRKIC